MIALTKAVGKDVAGSGILVNCIAPAVINTPIDPVESASVIAEQIRRRYTGIPVVR